ncbi:Thymidylate kinase [Candidatus Saccharibacteria bacterium RAAC3_TM7_1]|nr:Thymidylate kinase [Candidatus Saccharibacteria bacterium RAAC3_TM7_1]
MGRFIAIEGGDGSGKATQSKLLASYLREQGSDVLEADFPRYGEASAYYVERYLNGAYGGPNDVPAELGALPFALDRFAAKEAIIKHLQKPNAIVISNRYVASNLAHHGTKVSDPAERKAFYERIMLTEYGVFGIPRPDQNIVLVVPADLAQANVDKKEARSYTELKRDIHEADANHLELAKANYEELCTLYPDEFTAIDCTENGQMRAIDDIQSEIRTLVA